MHSLLQLSPRTIHVVHRCTSCTSISILLTEGVSTPPHLGPPRSTLDDPLSLRAPAPHLGFSAGSPSCSANAHTLHSASTPRVPSWFPAAAAQPRTPITHAQGLWRSMRSGEEVERRPAQTASKARVLCSRLLYCVP